MTIPDNNKINPLAKAEGSKPADTDQTARAENKSDLSQPSSAIEESKKLFKKEPETVAQADSEYKWSDEDCKLLKRLMELNVKLYGPGVRTYSEDSVGDWQGISQHIKTTEVTDIRYFDKNTKTFHKERLNHKPGESITQPMSLEEINEFIQATELCVRNYRHFIYKGAPGFCAKNLKRLIVTLDSMKAARKDLQSVSEKPAVPEESIVSEESGVSEIVEALTKPLETEDWQAVQDHPPRLIGIFIGVRDYIHNPPQEDGPKDLDYADSDARGLRDTLLRTGGKMWQEAENTVLVNHQATRENILAVINQHKGQLGPLDKIAFHFSGHGSHWKDEDTGEDHSYIVPADAWGGSENIGGLISDEEILTALASMSKDPEKPHQGINIFDCCNSGGIALKGIAKLYGSWNMKYFELAKGAGIYEGKSVGEKAKTLYPNSVTITATTDPTKLAAEVSREGDPGPGRHAGHGVLTLGVIYGLTREEGFTAADINEDGIISAEEVGKAVVPNQAEIYRRHPELPDFMFLGKERGYPVPNTADHYQTSRYNHPEEEIFTPPGFPEFSNQEIQRIQEEWNEFLLKQAIEAEEESRPVIKKTPEPPPEKPPEKKKTKTFWEWLNPFK